MKSPCLNCAYRSIDCHVYCISYAKFIASKPTNNERQRQHLLDDFMLRSIENTKQRWKKK